MIASIFSSRTMLIRASSMIVLFVMQIIVLRGRQTSYAAAMRCDRGGRMDPGWGGACSRGAETARERARGLGPCWGVGREACSSQPSLRFAQLCLLVASSPTLRSN